jgi:predicted phosphodiesterase
MLVRRKIFILHLSDLHIAKENEAEIYGTALISDLRKSQYVTTIHYLILSGDIGNYSTENEYKAACIFIKKIIEKMNLSYEKIIIAPGNHDLNWEISRHAYDQKNTIQNMDLYQQRFNNFNQYFYKIIKKTDYPSKPEEQAILHIFDDDKIIILSLNSSWEIDHINTKMASINGLSLSKALDKIMPYKGYLKIAVFHHPLSYYGINNNEMVNSDFMQLLSQNGFKICFHGHIHEARNNNFRDLRENISIIGGGTFGAPSNQQVPGIPLQYNILAYDKNKHSIRAHSRRKEKPEGAWYPDQRWPALKRKEEFLSYYDIGFKKKNVISKPAIAVIIAAVVAGIISFSFLTLSYAKAQKNYSVVIGSSVAMLGFSSSDTGALLFEKALKRMGVEANETAALYGQFKSLENLINADQMNYVAADVQKKNFNRRIEEKLFVLNGNDLIRYFQFGYDATTLLLFIKYWQAVKNDRYLAEEAIKLTEQVKSAAEDLKFSASIKNEFRNFKGNISNEPERVAFASMLREALAFYDIDS